MQTPDNDGASPKEKAAMSDYSYSNVLRSVIARKDLDRAAAYWAFGQIMDGLWTEAQVAGLLVAMAAKGETVDEIAGAAAAMREHVVKIDTAGLEVLDTCGTGGTGLSTFNVSTAAAMVLAGAGVTVAKHGNRTTTRASGSADVLTALGVKIDCEPAAITRCLQEAGVGFCFAVRCHPAMKYAAPVRKSLGVRTIFNVLGPLTNPAGARRQLMGVFDAGLTATIAGVLAALGASRAMVVHADDGMDEISITSATQIAEVVNGKVTVSTVAPEDFGLRRGTLADLAVDSPAASAQAVRDVLAGKDGPRRDIVLLNAAAALVVAEKVPSISQGLSLAASSIDLGKAATALEKLVAVSNS